MALTYICTRCQTAYSEGAVIWQCPCGGLLDLSDPEPFAVDHIDISEPGLWRYAAALPIVLPQERLRLGETMTPMIWKGEFGSWLKLDYQFPTGSYKDRGGSVLLSKLHSQGITEVVEDSSGNAGSSIAAYSAAAGITCNIFVPANNSPAKLSQIEAYGARLVPIQGDRSAVAQAALEAAKRTFYASHNWHPAFLAGVATLGFEIWEQLGLACPDSIILPCGHGGLILGVARAFRALARANSVLKLPRIFAVQSESFCSVVDAFTKGLSTPEPTQNGSTIAEGIACRVPLRGEAVLREIRATAGKAIAVTEDEIQAGLLDLLGRGFYTEPTSAVALAGFRKLVAAGEVDPTGTNVVVLTGSGLKTSRAIGEIIGKAHDAAHNVPAMRPKSGL
jgi:threonine synthase